MALLGGFLQADRLECIVRAAIGQLPEFDPLQPTAADEAPAAVFTPPPLEARVGC